MLIFILVEFATPPGRPFRTLAWLAPGLIAFNVSANVAFAPVAESYVEVRERAATSFMQYGEDGRGITRLHPQDRHADVLLRLAAERGVYRLPSVSHETTFRALRPRPEIILHFDELIVNDRAFTAGGWAMLPGVESRHGDVFVVLRSAQSTRYYSTVTFQRPDVAKAYDEPKWRRSGFRAVIERSRLPAEDFTLGVVLVHGGRADVQMTTSRLELSPGKPPAVVAGSEPK